MKILLLAQIIAIMLMSLIFSWVAQAQVQGPKPAPAVLEKLASEYLSARGQIPLPGMAWDILSDSAQKSVLQKYESELKESELRKQEREILDAVLTRPRIPDDFEQDITSKQKIFLKKITAIFEKLLEAEKIPVVERQVRLELFTHQFVTIYQDLSYWGTDFDVNAAGRLFAKTYTAALRAFQSGNRDEARPLALLSFLILNDVYVYASANVGEPKLRIEHAKKVYYVTMALSLLAAGGFKSIPIIVFPFAGLAALGTVGFFVHSGKFIHLKEAVIPKFMGNDRDVRIVAAQILDRFWDTVKENTTLYSVREVSSLVRGDGLHTLIRRLTVISGSSVTSLLNDAPSCVLSIDQFRETL